MTVATVGAGETPRFCVFAQREEPAIPVVDLVRNAARYFEAEVIVLAAEGAEARLEVVSARHGFRGVFGLVSRPPEAQDLSAARAAEVSGRAAGMSLLAERCARLWQVEPLGPASTEAGLALAALLASVALGPVLPSDHATLYGVRGAMERLERRLARRGV